MKTIFIPAKYTGKVDLSKINVDNLPKKLGLVTTVQFLDIVDNIKKYLKKNSKEIFIGKGKQKNPGQVLGCDISATEKIKDKVDAFLYIGSGEFHPLGVALNTKKEVFTFNPVSNAFSKINDNDIGKYKKIRKAKYVKFLHADNIGILVSTKPGQYSYKKAVEIKKKLEEKGKKCFIFVFDSLDANEMQNFPFIDFWVNTACHRIADDENKKNVIDMSELDLITSQ
jgi:2-(3-amino-3-carboxypropyl)histidine synthase|tara:strand:- start:10729 stop:11406 length:678 start_codon:yes stop_codon:yes gene_type:complete